MKPNSPRGSAMAVRDLPSLTPRQLLRKYLRKKAWRLFDWQQNFFLKPNDAISKLPLAGEVHDEDVVEALRHLAAALPDRFLDLGSNIGLVAMQIQRRHRFMGRLERLLKFQRHGQ